MKINILTSGRLQILNLQMHFLWFIFVWNWLPPFKFKALRMNLCTNNTSKVMENNPMNIINNMFKFNFFKRIQTI